MRWERFFEEIEAEIEREAEAAAAGIAAEERRVLDARAVLGDRLRTLIDQDSELALRAGELRCAGSVIGAGVDWVALSGTQGFSLIPLAAVDTVLTPVPPVTGDPPDRLALRITFGYVLRDLARRRVPVRVVTVRGEHLHGTIDRAGVDHFDLAMHDGPSRSARAVTGVRLLTFAATAAVLPDSTGSLPFG